MKGTMVLLEIRRPKSRLDMRRERRLRIAENVLNVALGVGSVAAAFWGGWLMGAGYIF